MCRISEPDPFHWPVEPSSSVSSMSDLSTYEPVNKVDTYLSKRMRSCNRDGLANFIGLLIVARVREAIRLFRVSYLKSAKWVPITLSTLSLLKRCKFKTFFFYFTESVIF